MSSSFNWSCPCCLKRKSYSNKYLNENLELVKGEERLPCRNCKALFTVENTKKLKEKIKLKSFARSDRGIG